MQRIAIVTGGNRGIGYEVCRGLVERDYHVLLASRDLGKGQQAADQLRTRKGMVTAYALDVTDAFSVRAFEEAVRREHGRADVLVNNAAVYLDEGTSIFDVPIERVRATFETNLYGPLMLCQAFLPLMIENRYGRIVNISSQAGQLSDISTFAPSYSLSKTALNGLTRILAQETRGQNIKVNSMCPGWVQTDMGGSGAPLTAEQGADTAIWLATLPDDGPTDGFFKERQPIEW